MAHEWTGWGLTGTDHEQGASSDPWASEYVVPEGWDSAKQWNAYMAGGGQPFAPASDAGWGQRLGVDRFAAGRPTWLPSIAEYRTPAEDWAAFQSQQQPFWSTRAPLADVGQNLRSRYLLGAPAMAQQPGAEPTFQRFLENWQGAAGGANPALLRRRALEASRAATTPQEEYIAGVPPGSPEWNERAWLQEQFGMGAENAMANQIGVAQMLALQRRPEAGGGVYRGRMADAIRNAMMNLYQGRVNVGAPKESFLDWYLGQTQAAPTTAAPTTAAPGEIPLDRFGRPMQMFTPGVRP